MSSRVAITGMSAFTPFGVGVEPLMLALHEGRTSVEPAPQLPEVGIALIKDFDALRYANVRGMRVYARATQLEICAVALALSDAGLASPGLPPAAISGAASSGAAISGAGSSGAAISGAASLSVLDPLELGLVTASSYSHLETLLDYDRGLTTLGMQRTNPTLMPLGLPSAPGAATALSMLAKAFAITLNDGGASGLAALGLGARLIAEGRAQVCVVAGAFTLFPELLLSESRARRLSSAERFRVLDRASAGIAFGEAAAALVLEPEARVLARGRKALGFVRAEASRFAASEPEPGAALGRACEAALRRAEVAPEGVALACLGANGRAPLDDAHAQAVSRALGKHALRTPVTAPKASLGESLDPSGLLQSIVAVSALRTRRAPPIARFETPRVPGLGYLSEPTALQPGAALLTAISPSGACSALVLSEQLSQRGE